MINSQILTSYNMCPAECEKGYRRDQVMLGSDADEGMNDGLPFNISALVNGVAQPTTAEFIIPV